MHRIDTPTAQADKFGPGKNGFTNGDPATGRRATDLNSDMWDAVQEEICAVIEKSGLALNKDQHDQLYQAIVKIITSKIPDALLKKNNLSDLADKALARANLQLKTAAQKDIVTSMTDTTSGRVPVVGWQGLGAEAQTITNAELVSSEGAGGRLFKQVGGSTNNHYGNYGVGIHLLYGKSGESTQQLTGNLFIDSSGNLFVEWLAININDGSVRLQNIQKLYGPLNKPTATDVDAVSASQGGTFQKPVTFNQGFNSIGKITLGDYTQAVGSNLYNAMMNAFDSSGKMRWAFGPYQNSWSIYAYNTDGSYKGLAFGIDHTTFNATVGGTITPGNYSNFDARYQAKGNYTPEGQAYTKAESDARYQLKNTASRAANGWFKDTTTGMIFQWGRNTSSVVGNTTVTFPIAFPNACLNVQNTWVRGANNPGQSPWGFVSSFNNTSASLSSDASGSYWYAIGY